MNQLTTFTAAEAVTTTVFIVNGAPRAGKDSLIHYLEEIASQDGNHVKAFSSIDRIRSMFNAMGINVEDKTPADRKLLATTGDAVEEHSHFRTNSCIEFVLRERARFEPPRPCTLFLHIREPENIERVRTRLQEAGIRVWRVLVRSVHAEQATNLTDAGVEDGPCDYIVVNNGTLKDLFNEADALLNLTRSRHMLPSTGLGRPIQHVSTRAEASTGIDTHGGAL